MFGDDQLETSSDTSSFEGDIPPLENVQDGSDQGGATDATNETGTGNGRDTSEEEAGAMPAPESNAVSEVVQFPSSLVEQALEALQSTANNVIEVLGERTLREDHPSLTALSQNFASITTLEHEDTTLINISASQDVLGDANYRTQTTTALAPSSSASTPISSTRHQCLP
ncbi:hypothetical protein HDU93_006517 [Gonapodya sp. JEL0774]|nr:hypothetical protein HDU93_006517 [Gonapodya sp. JEL0774]